MIKNLIRKGAPASEQLAKALRSLRWLPAHGWQRLVRRRKPQLPFHLLIAVADHFEPAIIPEAGGKSAERSEQVRRLDRWCERYPKAVAPWRDAEGFPMRHTYFYPAEQYDRGLIDCLAEHCNAGWGEIEIHLHHGVEAPDTPDHTRTVLVDFRDRLARHGCLSRWEGWGPVRYAFVHGNWALANSARGRFCGVDGEMQILAETGCYADLTLPSAPSPAQIAKINSLYECVPPLSRRAPHRWGQDLRCGRLPETFPLIVQGPLGLDFSTLRRSLPLPRIENGELTAVRPPTMRRLVLWQHAGIIVHGRPDWIFVKLHCHGMDPRDEEAMHGPPMRRFLSDLAEESRATGKYRVHFLTAREMVNVILAACDGRDGNPGEYRDYRLRPLASSHPGRGSEPISLASGGAVQQGSRA